MAFRREMHHPVNLVFLENPGDCLLVADIRFYKSIIIPTFHSLEIFKIARVGKGVHIDNTDFIVILLKHIMNIV